MLHDGSPDDLSVAGARDIDLGVLGQDRRDVRVRSHQDHGVARNREAPAYPLAGVEQRPVTQPGVVGGIPAADHVVDESVLVLGQPRPVASVDEVQGGEAVGHQPVQVSTALRAEQR